MKINIFNLLVYAFVSLNFLSCSRSEQTNIPIQLNVEVNQLTQKSTTATLSTKARGGAILYGRSSGGDYFQKVWPSLTQNTSLSLQFPSGKTWDIAMVSWSGNNFDLEGEEEIVFPFHGDVYCYAADDIVLTPSSTLSITLTSSACGHSFFGGTQFVSLPVEDGIDFSYTAFKEINIIPCRSYTLINKANPDPNDCLSNPFHRGNIGSLTFAVSNVKSENVISSSINSANKIKSECSSFDTEDYLKNSKGVLPGNLGFASFPWRGSFTPYAINFTAYEGLYCDDNVAQDMEHDAVSISWDFYLPLGKDSTTSSNLVSEGNDIYLSESFKKTGTNIFEGLLSWTKNAGLTFPSSYLSDDLLLQDTPTEDSCNDSDKPRWPISATGTTTNAYARFTGLYNGEYLGSYFCSSESPSTPIGSVHSVDQRQDGEIYDLLGRLYMAGEIIKKNRPSLTSCSAITTASTQVNEEMTINEVVYNIDVKFKKSANDILLKMAFSEGQNLLNEMVVRFDCAFNSLYFFSSYENIFDDESEENIEAVHVFLEKDNDPYLGVYISASYPEGNINGFGMDLVLLAAIKKNNSNFLILDYAENKKNPTDTSFSQSSRNQFSFRPLLDGGEKKIKIYDLLGSGPYWNIFTMDEFNISNYSSGPNPDLFLGNIPIPSFCNAIFSGNFTLDKVEEKYEDLKESCVSFL